MSSAPQPGAAVKDSRRLYSTQEAAEQLGVPAKAIADWKLRRRIMPADVVRGTSRSGIVPLYDLKDLRPHAEAYLKRKATRGTKGTK